MTYHWYRTANQSPYYNQGWWWLAAIPAGATVRRIRFGWGFQGFTEVTTDLHVISQNPLFAGIVTTIGDGSEVPPNPLDTPNDVDPPTLRWLWWEIRQPKAVAIDAAGGVVSWNDGGSSEPTNVETQVKATDIPGGDTLNVWFSYAGTYGGWDSSGSVQVFNWTSLLYSTP